MSADRLGAPHYDKKCFVFTSSELPVLDKLLFESGLSDPNFVEKNKWEELSRQCKWIVSSENFLLKSATPEGKDLIGKNPIVLGISPYELTDAVGLHISGKTFEAYYKKYGIDWTITPNHTEVFLNKIEKDEKVTSVVFLVPPNVFNFNAPPRYPWGKTKKEIQYLLDHPSKKLILVFGAYEMVDDNNFKQDFISDSLGVIDGKILPKEARRARWKIASEMKKYVLGKLDKI